jgi:hypothetical protein
MNADKERLADHLDTEAFLEKWMPHTLTPPQKSEFLMDLERLVLARTLEIDPGHRPANPEPGEFNWSEDGAIAIRRVCALAVYKSTDGDIVLRQEGPDGEQDTFVVIPLGFAVSVMDAIRRQFRDSVFPPVLSARPERS